LRARARSAASGMGRREAAGANPDDRDVCFAFRLDLSASRKLFLTVRIGAHERLSALIPE
jgi:hypothetical protein